MNDCPTSMRGIKQKSTQNEKLGEGLYFFKTSGGGKNKTKNITKKQNQRVVLVSWEVKKLDNLLQLSRLSAVHLIFSPKLLLPASGSCVRFFEEHFTKDTCLKKERAKTALLLDIRKTTLQRFVLSALATGSLLHKSAVVQKVLAVI